MRCRYFDADAMTVCGRQRLDAGFEDREQRLSRPGFGLPAKLPAGLNRIADIETQIDMAVVVRLNMLLCPHPLERRTQHLPNDDCSIREQVMTTKQGRIAREEVDIHAGDDFPESVRPNMRAYRGIGGKLRLLRFKEQPLKNRHRPTS